MALVMRDSLFFWARQPGHQKSVRVRIVLGAFFA
jgi:hypothetical protein